MFYSDSAVLEGAWRSSAVCYHHGHSLQSMVKSEAENDMEVRILMTSNSGSSPCGNAELTWCFITHSSGINKWVQKLKRSSKSYLAG
jgi:hypothetical protein